MNRLKGKRAYLCGAFDRVDDRGMGWRERITPDLKDMGIAVWNPLLKPIEIGTEDENAHAIKQKLKKSHRYDELSSMMKTIRAVDLRMVDVCDFVIASINIGVHASGTYEEIFLANRQKKPIIVHVEQGKENTPDWLFGTIPHEMIFSKWDEVEEYLSYINSSDEIEDHKRWYFFNV